MAKFFIGRPIVAMVIAILMVIYWLRVHGWITHGAVSQHCTSRNSSESDLSRSRCSDC